MLRQFSDKSEEESSFYEDKVFEAMQKVIDNYYSPKIAKTQEETLIGYLLINSNIISKVKTILETKEVFESSLNQRIFVTIDNLVQSLRAQNPNSDADIVITPDEVFKSLVPSLNVHEKTELEELGDQNYFVRCINKCGAFDESRALTTAKSVRNKYEKRVITHRLNELLIKIQGADTQKSELALSKLKSEIMNLQLQNSQGLQSPDTMVEKYLNNMSDIFFGGKREEVLNTGFKDLDNLLEGLRSGDLNIIAARPSMGKTLFALNIVNNILKQDPNKRIAFFSLEMSYEKLYNRLISNRLRIKSSKLKDKKHLSEEEYEKVAHTVNQFKHENLYIDDNDGTILTNIQNEIEEFTEEHNGIDLVIIDYLQLIDNLSEDNKTFNREHLISEVSRQLKKMAKKYNIPVIALAQLSRGVEQRQDKRPLLSDIRESGAIEQDADVVMFLYRDEYYQRKENKEVKNKAKDVLPKQNPFEETFSPTELDDEIVFKEETDEEKQQQEEIINSDDEVSDLEVIVAKNRDGKTGKIHLLAKMDYSSLTDSFTIPPK